MSATPTFVSTKVTADVPPCSGFRERLPPVSAEDLLRECSQAKAPHWLQQLGLPAERTNIRCLKLRTRIAKRAADIVIASTLLVLTFPLVLLAVLAIKLTSRGPAIFTQTRVGLNARRASGCRPNTLDRRREANYGRPFTIYKLRTMTIEANASGPSQAQRGDSRVLPIGRLLRQMRIDELPQLVNVLRGEMSMVGPRPECIEYMEELSQKVPNYLQRLGLKPGLTGIAQIEAGYANDLESYRRKVSFDLLYLQNCSLWNDLRIMLRTVRVVLTGFGAL